MPPSNRILNGLGAHRQFGILRIVERAINPAISVTLVNVTGLVGVALGTASPHAVTVGWIPPRTLEKILPLNLREYYLAVCGRTLLASIPFVLACWLVRTVVRPDGLASFFFWGLVSLPGYIAPAWLSALSSKERAHAMRAIAERRGRRTE